MLLHREYTSFYAPGRRGGILPTTSVSAAGGFTYDVVNRNGDVFERVQLPKGHVLVGFGAHNVVYLTKIDGKATYLERALLTGQTTP